MQLDIILIYLYIFILFTSVITVMSLSVIPNSVSIPQIFPSKRMEVTERPYIEDILDKYTHMENLTILALGSSYWTPPSQAMGRLSEGNEWDQREIHRYGNIQGYTPLRNKLREDLESRGLDMNELDILITPGANQAATNVFLSLVDPGDYSVILAPYYFSHKLALQLCGSNIIVCGFNPVNLKPDWNELSSILSSHSIKTIVLTNPNNPSGVVWTEEEIQKLIELCKVNNVWLVVDQTYHEFLYDGAKHIYPCAKRFQYSNIVHIFSMSKSYGMPGWRVGYIVHPKSMTDSLRKIQDTVPTHTSIISQKLSLHCLEENQSFQSSQDSKSDDTSIPNISWVGDKVKGLEEVRNKLWPILEPLGTCKTTGAFYFLVPLPLKISEEEAVDILANEYGILLMLGYPFGAKGYLRLSYGSIPPNQSIAAMDKIRNGLQHLVMLSKSK